MVFIFIYVGIRVYHTFTFTFIYFYLIFQILSSPSSFTPGLDINVLLFQPNYPNVNNNRFIVHDHFILE